MFGLKSAQVDEVASIMSVVARDWKELVAGSEGFLVGQGRAGLEDHAVVWGEMVSEWCAFKGRGETDLPFQG